MYDDPASESKANFAMPRGKLLSMDRLRNTMCHPKEGKD